MVCIRERKMYFKNFVLKGLNQRIQVQLWVNNWSNNKLTYFLQIIFSQLYFWAKRRKLGSMTPPRRRSTRWSVDSKNSENHGNVILSSKYFYISLKQVFQEFLSFDIKCLERILMTRTKINDDKTYCLV